MNETANIVLILLYIVCSIGFFLAGVVMLLGRPAKVDEDTGEPSYVWKAVTYLCFTLSAGNVRGVFSVQVNQIDSYWGISVRVIVFSGMTALLWALYKRYTAFVRLDAYPYGDERNGTP